MDWDTWERYLLLDQDSAKFKGAMKKFYKLFGMPKEEKLVNCKYLPLKNYYIKIIMVSLRLHP